MTASPIKRHPAEGRGLASAKRDYKCDVAADRTLAFAGVGRMG